MELLTITAQDGAGWNKRLVKYFGEPRGVTQMWKVHEGGGTKTFWVILPQICMSILWHYCIIGVGHENFPLLEGGLRQKICVFKGGMKMFMFKPTLFPHICWQLPWHVSARMFFINICIPSLEKCHVGFRNKLMKW